MFINNVLAFMGLLGLALAVDLKLYREVGCNKGRWIKCTNIPPKVCCSSGDPRSWPAQSNSCQNCGTNVRHSAWGMRGSHQACYVLVRSGAGGNNNCLSHGGAFSHGARWIFADPVKRSDEEEWGTADGPCVEPDTYSIDGRVFQITNTTSKDLADELRALSNAEPSDAREIPRRLKAIEITESVNDE